MIRIAFYKAENGKFIDKFISFFTNSIYSHCEIVFDDGMCASASQRDGGVRFKQIILSHNWDVYELVDENSAEVVREWFVAHEDNTYDYPGALGSFLKINLSSPMKKFCSQACAIVLGITENITPGELYNILVNSKRIK